MKRRDFLTRLGLAGGASALYGAMGALDLVPILPPSTLALASNEKGRGRKVLILGAGVAGMCTAYELGKLGYDCHILEARERPGGRCHTIRRGERVTDTDGETQVCAFDEGLYLNYGPARIPGHHVTLDYCRELGVAIEPMVNQNEAAYHYNVKGPLAGRRLRAREVHADHDGYVAELLAKAVGAHALDQELTEDDATRLLEFLHEMGELSKEGKYEGGQRRGYRVYPGAAEQPGVQDAPPALAELFRTPFRIPFFNNDITQQSQMFQIVGGTGNLGKAFAERLGRVITYQAPVREIRQDAAGVRVVYDHRGSTREMRGDYLVCTIPLSVLRDIPGDFSPEVRTAIRSVKYAETGKIGLQFNRRFWEEDDRIFGGISWTDQTITQIMYPSTGFLGQKGVVVGYYTWEPDAAILGALPHRQREEMALAQGEKIHPQYRQHLETSFSVYWPKVPYTLGGWADWGDGPTRPPAYALLNRPDGRIYLAGEHLSYLTGWMAGGLESARLAIAAIHQRAVSEAPRGDGRVRSGGRG